MNYYQREVQRRIRLHRLAQKRGLMDVLDEVIRQQRSWNKRRGMVNRIAHQRQETP